MRYEKPATLSDAIALLKGGEARALAGGTDLLVRLGREAPWPGALVDLKALPELRGIAALDGGAGGLRIGAGVTLSELRDSPALASYPALAEACRVFAARLIRARATLGGNLANASPAADGVPPLIAYGAVCVTDRRRLAVEELATGPGATALARDELIVAVDLPRPAAESRSVFHRLASRDAMAIAIAGVAVYLEFVGGAVTRARVALGAVAPTVMRARAAEAALEGSLMDAAAIERAARAAAAECRPIDDIRATARYRRLMVERILRYELARLSSNQPS